MTERITLQLHEPAQAHKAFDYAWRWAKAMLIAGHRLTLQVKPATRSLAQNRRYWGRGVLAQIADQAVVGGRKYDAEVWHEQFKRMFIGVREMPNGSVVGMSSTKLTVSEFSEFCEQVEVYATSELGVTFCGLEC